jgi:uncharacterized protein YgiM (DUF1202 family)
MTLVHGRRIIMYDRINDRVNYSGFIYKKDEDSEELKTGMDTKTYNVTIAPSPRKPITVVNCLFLNVRKQPTIDSRVISVLKNGTEVQVDYNDDEWAQVTLSTGNVGYVMNKFLDI